MAKIFPFHQINWTIYRLQNYAKLFKGDETCQVKNQQPPAMTRALNFYLLTSSRRHESGSGLPVSFRSLRRCWS